MWKKYFIAVKNILAIYGVVYVIKLIVEAFK